MTALSLENVSFSYPGNQELFTDLSCVIEEGSFVLLTGSVGAGKTSLLRLIKPELTPAGILSGAIKVFGQEVSYLTAQKSAGTVGYVFQDPENQIVCDTVWHELAFGLENLGTDQEAMRRRVAEVAHFFGIESWMGRSTAQLSGGQKQILALAGVLVMQPKILLLDEPTAQLDPVAEKNFLHALFRINRELGMTIVVATHSPEKMVSYATESLLLRDGRLTPCSPATFIFKEALHQESLSEGGPATAPEDVIMLKDAFFRYAQNDPWVLRGLDLSIKRGSIHAIIGGNGSGKSTLLNLIAGVLKPQQGRIRNALVQAQALLPQDPKALFMCDSAAEELREWQKTSGFTEDDINEALKFFNLTDYIKQHPYDLSGGQQQNLAFAKVLLTKPELLLLDEPVKGLDAEAKCDIAQTLEAVSKEGVTVVLVTHDLAFAAQVANTTTLLFDGEATATEPTDEFFKSNLFYRPQPDGFTDLWSMRQKERQTNNPAGLSGYSEPAEEGTP